MINKKYRNYNWPILILCIGFFISNNQVYSKSKMDQMTSAKAAKKASSPLIPAMQHSSRKLHAVGFGLGQTFLHGDFGVNGDDKITPDLFYSYRASHSFDFIANLHFSEHKVKNRKTSIAGLALGLKAKVYQIDAFSPFFIGGLGFYEPILHREINGKIVESQSKITFGAHVGAGAELKLNNRVSVGILGQWHNPFDVQQEDQTDEVEGYYFKLLITGFYYF